MKPLISRKNVTSQEGREEVVSELEVVTGSMIIDAGGVQLTGMDAVTASVMGCPTVYKC